MRHIATFRMERQAELLGFAIRNETRVTRTQKPHRHEFFQLRLDLEGEADHDIGSRRRRLTAGTVTFVAPYRIHRGGRGACSQFYVINFHHRFLRPGLAVDSACTDAWPVAAAPELLPFVFQDFIDFRLDGEDLRLASEACAAMLAHSRSGRLFAQELIRANLFLLIGTVCQRYEGQLAMLHTSNGPAPTHAGALTRVMRYISDHLTENVALTDVAAAAEVSPSYVTQLLKKETGKTFVDFLTALRLQKAQELLVATDMRIGEVAVAVGYSDDAYFARRFRQFLRVSPGEYRRSAVARRSSVTH